MPEKSRIFLVDDHPLVREWLTNLIHQQPDLVVCGEAETGADALAAVTQVKPDVMVVDLSLKEGSGLDLIKAMKTQHPHVACLVLSMHDEKDYAERVVRAGARGYITKRESAKKIIAAIHTVLSGQLAVSEEMVASLAGRAVPGKGLGESSVSALSDRELEVFRLLGQGLGTRQVSNMLGISIKTVQAYCARIKEKLKITNATELMREAVRWHENRAAG